MQKYKEEINIDMLRSEFKDWQDMSCRPSIIKKLKEGTIIDEEQSVRWNREEVQRRNEEYEKEVKQLNALKNKARDAFYEKLYMFIMNEVGNGCTREKAMIIWNHAYEDGHSYGWSHIECFLYRYIEFAEQMLSM